MDAAFSLILIVVGVICIAVALASAFRTVVVPRGSFDPLTRAVFLSLRSVFVAVADRIDRLDRETVLGAHAPLALLTMAAAWALGIIFGFALLFWATADGSLGDAIVLAGSSFTTLGFVAPDPAIHDILAIAAAIFGLFIVALLISYLPVIYGLFSRREVVVADVSIKCGGTAHGPDLVRSLTRPNDTARLDAMWADWGQWFITLGETHTSEPALTFYRSPQVHRSWLTAATAIIDAAALRNTVVAAPFSIRADMTYRSGVEALASIAHFFSDAPESDKDHVTVLTRADFDRAARRLTDDSIPLVDDLDAAWQEFRELREAYELYVLGLARLVLPPTAPWSTDLLERPLPGMGQTPA